MRERFLLSCSEPAGPEDTELRHAYGVRLEAGSQAPERPQLDLGSAIDSVWDLGNLLHLPVFSSVKQGYDGADLGGLGGFRDIKELAVPPRQRQLALSAFQQPDDGHVPVPWGEGAMSLQPLPPALLLPARPKPSSARKPSVIALISVSFALRTSMPQPT